jgi:hypothetical protein
LTAFVSEIPDGIGREIPNTVIVPDPVVTVYEPVHALYTTDCAARLSFAPSKVPENATLLAVIEAEHVVESENVRVPDKLKVE